MILRLIHLARESSPRIKSGLSYNFCPVHLSMVSGGVRERIFLQWEQKAQSSSLTVNHGQLWNQASQVTSLVSGGVRSQKPILLAKGGLSSSMMAASGLPFLQSQMKLCVTHGAAQILLSIQSAETDLSWSRSAVQWKQESCSGEFGAAWRRVCLLLVSQALS